MARKRSLNDDLAGNPIFAYSPRGGTVSGQNWNETGKPFVYRPLDSANHDIRLVRLRLDYDSGDLAFHIQNVSIKHAPAFRALSYTWGKSSAGTMVQLNNGVYKVNNSLYPFLSQLTQDPEDAEAWYWIDAICIDQANVVERNEQVLRMKEIYEAATQVVVWLGSPRLATPLVSRSSSYAAKFLTGLKKLDLLPRKEPMGDFPTTLAMLHERKGPGKLNPEALVRIFESSWWERAWIIQEASTPVKDISQPSLVWIGPLRYSLNACLQTSASVLEAAARGDTKYRVPTMVDDLAWIRARRSDTSSRLEIYDLLPRVRRYEASDMRDKIYSILAISRDYDAKDLKPDYGKPTSEIYTSLVRYLIERDQKLDILAYCSEKRKIEGLPSWVPDWSYRNVPTPFPRRCYNACGDLPWKVSFQNWGSSIRCRGVHIASVHAVGPVRDDSVKRDPNQSPLSQSWFTFGMMSLSGNAYHRSYRDQLFTLRHVLCADVADWDGSAQRRHSIEWPSETFSYRFEFSKGDFASDSDMDKATNLRRLMSLENDLLGLGPADASAGDFVYVLGGLQVPLVLRKVQDHFIIIGECYVHGIMETKWSLAEDEIRDIDIW